MRLAARCFVHFDVILHELFNGNERWIMIGNVTRISYKSGPMATSEAANREEFV